MPMIAVAFRKPGTPLVGMACAKTMRALHNIVSEVAPPEECEFTEHGLYLGSEIHVRDDDYKAEKVSSNLYELASEPHSWFKIDWTPFTSMKGVSGLFSSFDPSQDPPESEGGNHD